MELSNCKNMIKIAVMMTNLEKNKPSFRMWLTLTVQRDITTMIKTINTAIDVTIRYSSDTVMQSKSLASSQ